MKKRLTEHELLEKERRRVLSMLNRRKKGFGTGELWRGSLVDLDSHESVLHELRAQGRIMFMWGKWYRRERIILDGGRGD